MREETLGFCIDGDRVWLGEHQRGPARGKLNGYGGKVEGDESLLDCLRREVVTETSIVPVDPIRRAEILFRHTGSEDRTVHVYTFTDYRGRFRDTEEMANHDSYPIESLPYDRMWDADRFWLRHVLAGSYIEASFAYEGRRVTGQAIRSLEVLPTAPRS